MSSRCQVDVKMWNSGKQKKLVWLQTKTLVLFYILETSKRGNLPQVGWSEHTNTVRTIYAYSGSYWSQYLLSTNQAKKNMNIFGAHQSTPLLGRSKNTISGALNEENADGYSLVEDRCSARKGWWKLRPRGADTDNGFIELDWFEFCWWDKFNGLSVIFPHILFWQKQHAPFFQCLHIGIS